MTFEELKAEADRQGYNLVKKMDKTGKVSFLSLAGAKDKLLKTTMIQ